MRVRFLSHSSLFHERVHSHTRTFFSLPYSPLSPRSVCILACVSFGSHITCQCIGLSVWLCVCVCMHFSSSCMNVAFSSCWCHSLLSVTQIRIVFKNQTKPTQTTVRCMLHRAEKNFKPPFSWSHMLVCECERYGDGCACVLVTRLFEGCGEVEPSILCFIHKHTHPSILFFSVLFGVFRAFVYSS